MDNYFQGIEYSKRKPICDCAGEPTEAIGTLFHSSTLVWLLFAFRVLEIFRVIIRCKTSIHFIYLYLAVMFIENLSVIGRMYCGGEISTENLGRTEMQWNEICISKGSITPSETEKILETNMKCFQFLPYSFTSNCTDVLWRSFKTKIFSQVFPQSLFAMNSWFNVWLT